MKVNQLFSLVLVLSVVGISSAKAKSQIVELPIARIFVPARGFDDNDSVEAVVDGELPNACYLLEKQSIKVDESSKVITVRQFAIRLGSGTCKEGSEPNSPEFITPIPFTETISLGKLDSGDYKIAYYPKPELQSLKAFLVGSSPVPNLDSLPYAMVTEVSVSDVVTLSKPIQVEIRGILNNSCYHLNEKIGIETIDNVTVVLPTVTIDRQAACLMFTRPFTAGVTLPPILSEGRYLVHVRSMNGKSLNRVYTVERAPL